MTELKEKRDIPVGGLDVLEFSEGFYVYVGSALNSLEARVGRHLRKEKKRFWHIDYLLEHAAIVDVLYAETSRRAECELAAEINRELEPVQGFGCSDCNCNAHLFHSSSLDEAIVTVEEAFNDTGLASNTMVFKASV